MGVGWVPLCTTLVEGGEILHGGGSLERFCGCDGAGNNCHWPEQGIAFYLEDRDFARSGRGFCAHGRQQFHQLYSLLSEGLVQINENVGEDDVCISAHIKILVFVTKTIGSMTVLQKRWPLTPFRESKSGVSIFITKVRPGSSTHLFHMHQLTKADGMPLLLKFKFCMY